MPDSKKYDLDFAPDSYFGSGDAGRTPPDTGTSFSSGAFLPGFDDTETEIVRITLESTTFDIISLRAGLIDEKIHYSVVDEYDGEYVCKPQSSGRPLTMRQLIDLMEKTETSSGCTGLVLGRAQDGFECTGYAEQWVHFATVSSDFYPQLGEWYFDALEEWYEENKDKDLTLERPGLP
jgi:hypothetical protein